MEISYSVVIPVYNTATSLVELARRLEKVFLDLDVTFEVIFVDDASPKKETGKVLRQLSSLQNVKVITLTRNFGQQVATLCGLEHSAGEYVITMDDDLQHKPEDIPELIRGQSHSIVLAQLVDIKHGYFRRITSYIKERFDRAILGVPAGLKLCSFRMLKRHVVDGMLQIKSPSPFISALMLHVTRDIKGVKINHGARSEGVSGYNFIALLRLFSFLLINNSSLLLRFIGRFGILLFLFSVLMVVYLFYKHYVGGFVAGWVSTIAAITMFGGIQLFTLGIMGEYLLRILNYSQNKPAYFVKETLE